MTSWPDLDAALQASTIGILVAVISVALSGCNGSPTEPTPPPVVRPPSEPTLQSLETSGTTTFQDLGVMSQLTAIAGYSDGSSENVSDRSIWQTSNPAVVTVSGTGLLTTVGYGEADVTVRFESLADSVRVSVTAPAARCALSLSEAAAFNRPGGSGTLSVQTGEGCYWAASTDVSWITMVGTSDGRGPGSVTFVVAPLTNGAARTGTITVKSYGVPDVFVPIRQENVDGPEPSFRYYVTPDRRTVQWEASSRWTVTVTTSRRGARWTATSDQEWLVVTEGTSGTGQGLLRYRVEENPLNLDRIGTIIVAGLSGQNPPALHTVRQRGRR